MSRANPKPPGWPEGAADRSRRQEPPPGAVAKSRRQEPPPGATARSRRQEPPAGAAGRSRRQEPLPGAVAKNQRKNGTRKRKMEKGKRKKKEGTRKEEHEKGTRKKQNDTHVHRHHVKKVRCSIIDIQTVTYCTTRSLRRKEARGHLSRDRVCGFSACRRTPSHRRCIQAA